MVLNNSEHKYRAQKNISNIFLTGLCGSGKTVIGRHLARRMGFGYLDLDQWIEKTAGIPVWKIFSEKGERWFRDQETEAVHEIKKITGHVISLGGGTLQNDENWDVISGLGVTVWINTPPRLIASRFAKNDDELRKRPLLAEMVSENLGAEKEQALQKKLEDQLSERMAGFSQAHMVFSDGFVAPDDAALRIRQILGSREFQKSLKKSFKQKDFSKNKEDIKASEGG